MTKNLSLDELLAKRGAGETVHKAAKAPPSWDSERRTARFVMSSESVDRMGDIVVQAGLDIERFMENPQALLFHNSRNFPIGTWSDVKKVSGRPRRTEGTMNLIEDGVDEIADRVAAHIGAGTLRAVSIGFMPKKWELIRDDEDNWTGGIKFNESELFECSIVPIPAQPDAMAKAAAGDPDALKKSLEQAIDEWCAELADLGVNRDDYIAMLRSYEPKKTISTPKVEIDDELERAIATEAQKAVAQMGEGIIAKVAKMFGLKAQEEQVVEEPAAVVEEEDPVEPIAEFVAADVAAAAKEQAKAALARIQASRKAA